MDVFNSLCIIRVVLKIIVPMPVSGAGFAVALAAVFGGNAVSEAEVKWYVPALKIDSRTAVVVGVGTVTLVG